MMWDYHGYRVFIFGALLFVILHGVCAVLADTNRVMVLKRGSSLNLTLTYPQNSVSSVQWFFNDSSFAEYSQSTNYTFEKSQFSGRVKGIHDIVGVTLQDLQLQDSGTFTTVAFGPKEQYPTQKIQVYIQNPITVVKIVNTPVSQVPQNSCHFGVKCAALEAESVSYLWSGYKNVSGDQLQFSLSPAEGAVSLNCTASNNVSSKSVTETLICNTETGATWMLIWIAIGGGVTFIMITALIISLNCYRKSHKNAAADGSTVYADVNPRAVTKKDKRSDTIAEGMTVYETVDDLRIAQDMSAQTIYAKVTLPQHTKVCANPSSPYQKVL